MSTIRDQTKFSPTLDTLVGDLQKSLTEGVDISKEIEEDIGGLKELLIHRLSPEARTPEGRGLRMSNLGSRCLRKLWYNVNTPEKAESLDASTRLKFLYGDILEWLVLLIAKAAGHKVEGQQSELDIEGIKGHRDAIIDGTLVDVKTASKFGFKKFKEGAVPLDDPFGYMDQLGIYHHASLDELENKETASFLAIEKESGHLVLDTYKMNPNRDWKTEVNLKKEMVALPEPPERGFKPIPHQKSGNECLPLECSYCPFKAECYKFRTFIYAGKPIFMTKVVREPEVQEIK